MKKKDLTGKVFGRLTVVKELTERDRMMIVWECLCECGSIHNVPGEYLVCGDVQSCGCMKKDLEKVFYKIGREQYKEETPEQCEERRKQQAKGKMCDNYVRKSKRVVFIRGEALKEFAPRHGIPYDTLLKVFRNYGEDAVFEYVRENSGKNRFSSLELCVKEHYGYEPLGKTYRVDRYYPDFKITDTLFMNADGLFFHSEAYKKDKEYHKLVREEFEHLNKRILQFYPNELHSKHLIVKSMIANALGEITNKIGARKCEVVFDHADRHTFFTENHLMDDLNAAKFIGLVYNNEIIAAMSYRAKNGGVDISRFCNKINTSVQGGFSKLLKELIKKESPKFITNFVDMRYGTGKHLEKYGFVLENCDISFKWVNGSHKFLHRMQIRANMDERGLTEAEYAKELGYYKVWDAGQAKFTLNLP